MDILTKALDMFPIKRQKEVIGRWLDGEQAGAEFAIWSADRIDDFPPDLITETRVHIRDIQRMLVSDIVAHGDFGGGDDPLIREFFAQRLAA